MGRRPTHRRLEFSSLRALYHPYRLPQGKGGARTISAATGSTRPNLRGAMGKTPQGKVSTAPSTASNGHTRDLAEASKARYLGQSARPICDFCAAYVGNAIRQAVIDGAHQPAASP